MYFQIAIALLEIIDKNSNIFFSFRSGFVDLDKVMEYGTHREKFVKKGHSTSFKLAVQEMDEYMLDPTVSMKLISSELCSS